MNGSEMRKSETFRRWQEPSFRTCKERNTNEPWQRTLNSWWKKLLIQFARLFHSETLHARIFTVEFVGGTQNNETNLDALYLTQILYVKWFIWDTIQPQAYGQTNG